MGEVERQEARENIEAKATILGEFKNKHGEIFLVYRLKALEKSPLGGLIYVTGDELDWETGWRFVDNHLAQEFLLTEDEFNGIKKILKGEK